MEINKIPGTLMIAALFLLLSHSLWAQEDGYYIEYNDGKPKFIQRLVWEKTEYAWYYEVLIYALDNGGREYSKNTTEDNELLVSLPPGKYRYSVTPYDLLKHRGEPSAWREFEVLPAFQPVINSFAPDVFYLDRILDRELRLTGDNLLEASEIYLKKYDDYLYPEKIIITDGKSATLVFDDMKLEPGSYDIYVKNPGGLSAQSGKFEIGYRKPLDFFLKLAWTPLIPLYGDKAAVNNPALSFAGMAFSFEVISSKRGDINGGLELAASAHYFSPGIILQTDVDDSETDTLENVNGTLYTAYDLNIVLQKRFNRGRMALSFRFGVGGAIVNDHMASDIGVSGYNDVAIKFNLGVEYMMRIYKVFYLEAGLDFNTHISSHYPDFLIPRLGITWQF
jgi:hypothetical protein